MPRLLPKIEAANRFVNENYYCAGKNVDWLCDAKIICLGENHLDETHQQNNGLLIDELLDVRDVENKDIALVEGALEDVATSKQIQYVWKQSLLDREGWDNRQGKLSGHLTLAGFYSVFAGAIIGHPLVKLGALCFAVLKIKPVMACSAFLISMGASYFKNTKTQEIFKKAVEETVPISNQHMIQIIEKNLQRRKVYVTAGAAHFDGALYNDFEAVALLQDYLKDKKHIILIPKDLKGYTRKKTQLPSSPLNFSQRVINKLQRVF